MNFENDFYLAKQRFDNSIENARKMLDVSIKVANRKFELSITNARVQLEAAIKNSRHTLDTSIQIAKHSLEDSISFAKSTFKEAKLSNEENTRAISTSIDISEILVKREEENHEENSEETNRQTLNNDFQMNTESKSYQDGIHNELSEEILNSDNSQPLNDGSLMNTESTYHQKHNLVSSKNTSKGSESHEGKVAGKSSASAANRIHDNNVMINISDMPSTKQSLCQTEPMHDAENRNDKSVNSNKRKVSVFPTEVQDESEKCSKVIKIEDDESESDLEGIESPNQSFIESAEHSKNVPNYLQMYRDGEFNGIIPRGVICAFIKTFKYKSWKRFQVTVFFPFLVLYLFVKC